MHQTKNGLPLSTRENVVSSLTFLLADSLDLYSQCKQAHWNVRGPGFIALHELFDRLSTEVNLASDTIAERILQLGGTAPGTVRVAAADSRLKEYPITLGTGEQHAEALSLSLAEFNTMMRNAIDETADLNDAITTDMLTGIVRGLDKQLWFVESHLPMGAEMASKFGGVKMLDFRVHEQ